MFGEAITFTGETELLALLLLHEDTVEL